MADSKTPTSKVTAATVGSGVGATVAGFALWLLGVLAWGAPADAASATDAVAAVPGPVSALVLVVVTGAVTFASGYMKSETLRPGTGRHRA